LLNNVPEKAARNAQYEMPFYRHDKKHPENVIPIKHQENVIPTTGRIPQKAHINLLTNAPKKNRT
jgi:hypothetical protein